ncbi:acetylhydrolase [Acidocella aquatica]|uniref:Acetylhydrolase n=1 Tax=Acidocella aquatica TaxID=1922313 RepID=A0ABQ6A9K4_9PROT|nr:alpha/beta hydrolase [Acidocella aquatica]GLR68243.1 acetylhydrolase [Acidocella aquatica]
MTDAAPHPYHQAIIDAYAAAGRPYFHQVTPPEARAMLRAGLAAAPAPVGLPVMAAVVDETIAGPNGPIGIRRYVPEGAVLGTCVYFHAGGWVIGDLDLADATCRRIAGAAQGEIISVDYRLAPEHPFPQPLDDAFAALQWAARERPGPLLVMGESAGGNLAAACAIRARAAGGPALAGQCLAYPVTDHDFGTGSYRDVGDKNWLLSTADMRWFWDNYCPPGTDRTDPLVSPLHVENPAGLPAALIVNGELDPLCDEGVAYAARIRNGGVLVVTRRDPGMVHGYLSAAGAIPLVAEALAEVAAWIKERLQIAAAA